MATKQIVMLAAGAIAVYLVVSTPIASNSAGTTDETPVDEVFTMLTGVADYINAWADAITSHEGWAVGSRSYRNNNPGNLRVTGDLGVDSGGFGVFSEYNLGRNALTGDLSAKMRKYSSWTVYQIMARYAPPSDGNDTQAYADAVAAALRVTSQTVVSAIPGIWSSQSLTWAPMQFVGSPTVTAPVQVASTSTSSASTASVSGASDPSAYDPTLDYSDGSEEG